MSRLTTWLRRLRGAVGIGLFGSLTLIVFGSFVRVLSGVFYGQNVNLLGDLVPMGVFGFIGGLVAAGGIALAAQKRKPSPGWVFAIGVLLGEGLTLATRWIIQARLRLRSVGWERALLDSWSAS